MASINVNEATTGDLVPIAVDEVGGDSYPLNKIVFGGAGTATQVSGNEPLPVKMVPNATGAGTNFYTNSLLATVQSIKASAGRLYSLELTNDSAAKKYVHLYNVASGSVTVGTTPSVRDYVVPANSNIVLRWPEGLPFSTAISIAATTTLTGTTAPAASEVLAGGLLI